MNKQYIGDSIYAEFKDNQLILTTENGLPTDPSNTIIFEPEVWRALTNYVDNIPF